MGIIDLIKTGSDIISKTLVPLAFALALFYFFWGVAKYIRTDAGGQKAAEEGRRIMTWGVVGLFVAFSVWGIITFIQKELKLPKIDKVNILGG